MPDEIGPRGLGDYVIDMLRDNPAEINELLDGIKRLSEEADESEADDDIHEVAENR